MKVTFLGTGAADWVIEKDKGLKDFRRNSSLLIDDCLLIDPGPNVLDALTAFKKQPEKIKHIINTHNHYDHYSEETVKSLKNATFYPLAPKDVVSVGEYVIRAYLANHGTENPLHFIIQKNGKSIFYGLDGAWLTLLEAKAIKEFGIDLAVLDATVGNSKVDKRLFEHNNLSMVKDIKNALEPYVKTWYISHMAKTLHTSHAKLSAQMKRYNVLVAKDGLEIEV